MAAIAIKQKNKQMYERYLLAQESVSGLDV